MSAPRSGRGTGRRRRSAPVHHLCRHGPSRAAAAVHRRRLAPVAVRAAQAALARRCGPARPWDNTAFSSAPVIQDSHVQATHVVAGRFSSPMHGEWSGRASAGRRVRRRRAPAGRRRHERLRTHPRPVPAFRRPAPARRGRVARPFPLPPALAEFYAEVGPLGPVVYEHVGPVGVTIPGTALAPLAKLWVRQAGYRWDGNSGERLTDWPEDWLVIADQHADPLILEMSTGRVLYALHGAGRWDAQWLAPDCARWPPCWRPWAVSMKTPATICATTRASCAPGTARPPSGPPPPCWAATRPPAPSSTGWNGEPGRHQLEAMAASAVRMARPRRL